MSVFSFFKKRSQHYSLQSVVVVDYIVLIQVILISVFYSLATSTIFTFFFLLMRMHLDWLLHILTTLTSTSISSWYSSWNFLSDYYLCNVLKYFLYILTCLSWSFEKWETMLFCKCFPTFTFNYLIWSIALICYKNFCYIRTSMLVNLFQPILNIIEGLFFGTIIDKNNAHCSLIICLCNSSETFLTCCVPNLKFYSFLINIDCFYLKINT